MNHPNCLLITTVLGLACLGALAPTAVAVAADPEIPEPGLYWRAPRPDSLGNMNYALGARAELHAAPVELARVDRVVYFAGGSVIGQVTNPPYTFDWTVAGSGAVTLRAEARDGAGVVQGWCERTIQVIGEGLQVAQSALTVSVAPGATTTVNLDLTNLGPGNTEWAIHIQGGMAPGGTNGNIVSSFANPYWLTGSFSYRHRGTATTDDDEIWLGDLGYPDSVNKLRRRSTTDWSELGIFTSPYQVGGTPGFAAEGDGLWQGRSEGGYALVDPNTAATIRQFAMPQQDVYPSYFISTHPAAGVFYAIYNNRNGQPVDLCSFVQFRDRDGLLIADHGGIPAFSRNARYTTPGTTGWSDGHVWLIDSTYTARSTIEIWRWHPGMTDALHSLSIPTSPNVVQAPGCCRVTGSGQPGFLWVLYPSSDWTSGYVLHVDTGLRPWLKLAEQSGTLANGAGRTVSVTIDATTAPEGTYQAVLAITQYPNSLIPQICVPVTLTVTSAGGNQPPTLVSPAWAAPAAVTLPAGTTAHVVASDPDGDPLTYAWSKVSGPGTATFATPDATDSGVTFSAAGTYVLRVAVSDGNGGNVTSAVSVAVTSDVDARADCNGDGVVNALDLQIVIANFGKVVP